MKVLRNMLAAASLLLVADSGAAMSPGIGEVVSDATFTTAYGQTLKIGDLRGEVVVLTYWTTDCEPCTDQLKTLDYYYRQRASVGLRVLAISADEMSNRELRHAFAGRRVHPLSDIRGPFEPLGALPTTYVIDRNGQVRYAASGALGIEELNRILMPLIRQPQP
jgi:cytochrome c biogenesis protein CcmG, thiol:disulfide interchange protein DsbE